MADSWKAENPYTAGNYLPGQEKPKTFDEGCEAQAEKLIALLEANMITLVIEKPFQEELVAIPKEWWQQLKKEVENGAQDGVA